MKNICIFLVILLLAGCADNKNPKDNVPDTGSNPDVTDIDNKDNEEPNVVPSAYFTFSGEQQVRMKEIVEESNVYDNYTPTYDFLGVDFYRNRIGITAQPKDWPTLALIRFEDLRFDNNPAFVYFLQRFYREEVEFTYLKDNVTRKAKLEVSDWINQDNNVSSEWHDRMIECSVYVPGSGGQTNYPFSYDFLDDEIYVINDKGEREEIIFTLDLHNQILEQTRAMIVKFIRIDEAAQDLARVIIAYVEEVEKK